MGTLVVLLVGQAMASMDASILVVAAPSLRADLHASGAELQMVVAMYTIAFAAMVVTGARLGDVLGRRRAFLLGLAGFTVSSLLGGLAPIPVVLIIARAAQGLSGAVMTPQVLSIIQARFEGEARARAIGAYSMILAVGVAAGQVLGGLLVSAKLVAAAWRPALLLNVPVGAVLLLIAPRVVPIVSPERARRLDPRGAATLGAALLALVVPLTLGRAAGWPAWVWPCLGGSVGLLVVFVALERRIVERGSDPLFDRSILTIPGLATGVLGIMVVMSAYAGFLLSLTLYLQNGLGSGALHAGATFSAYALGFASASLTWTRCHPGLRDRLPAVGPVLMGCALLAVGLIAGGGGWPIAATTPLLFCAGAGHACGFSPLANRLTSAIRSGQAADLSGLIMTASLVGQVVGVAAFVGIYLDRAPGDPRHALAVTTVVLAVLLTATGACVWRAARRPFALRHWDGPLDWWPRALTPFVSPPTPLLVPSTRSLSNVRALYMKWMSKARTFGCNAWRIPLLAPPTPV